MEYTDGIRDTWEFNIPIADLLKAAQAKVAFHTERLAYYKKLESTAKTNLRDNGIIISDDLNLNVSYSNSNQDVSLDPVMKKAHQDALIKVRQHKDFLAEFQRFVYVFELSINLDGGDTTLPCTVKDIEAFALAGTIR